MKFLFKSKDGGSESNVTGYWLFEIKWLASIVVLRFNKGSRESFHSHAFNSVSWLLKGELSEQVLNVELRNKWMPNLKPILINRNRFHRVFGISKHSWVLSFRGPWLQTWKEFNPKLNKEITLSTGRIEVK